MFRFKKNNIFFYKGLAELRIINSVYLWWHLLWPCYCWWIWNPRLNTDQLWDLWTKQWAVSMHLKHESKEKLRFLKLVLWALLYGPVYRVWWHEYHKIIFWVILALKTEILNNDVCHLDKGFVWTFCTSLCWPKTQFVWFMMHRVSIYNMYKPHVSNINVIFL